MTTANQNTTGPYELHEVTDIFPPMAEEQYNKLVEDIRENGQREPVWLYDRKVIDGRNRLRACLELGIELTSVRLKVE